MEQKSRLVISVVLLAMMSSQVLTESLVEIYDTLSVYGIKNGTVLDSVYMSSFPYIATVTF